MENPTYELFSILIFFTFVLVSLSSVTTIVPASIPATLQSANIALLELQEINQAHENSPLIQIATYNAQGNTIAIVNWQISSLTQVVNELLYIFDLFHNLSSIKDFLEIFVIVLIIIISIISVYIYRHYKNGYL